MGSTIPVSPPFLRPQAIPWNMTAMCRCPGCFLLRGREPKTFLSQASLVSCSVHSPASTMLDVIFDIEGPTALHATFPRFKCCSHFLSQAGSPQGPTGDANDDDGGASHVAASPIEPRDTPTAALAAGTSAQSAAAPGSEEGEGSKMCKRPRKDRDESDTNARRPGRECLCRRAFSVEKKLLLPLSIGDYGDLN